MGGFIVESTSVAPHTEEFSIDHCFKDSSKKKKRRSRRSKPNSLPSACASVTEIFLDELTLMGCTSSTHAASPGHQKMHKENNLDFTSMPTPYINEDTTDVNMQNLLSDSHELDEMIFSKFGTENFVSQEPDGLSSTPRRVELQARQIYFPPHLSKEAVSEALNKGELLSALFHVNAHNRFEAYCKIDGLQTDVLISGMVAQNRAFEGDTVVIIIDPPSLWPKIKGSTETPNDTVSLPNCSWKNGDKYLEDTSKRKGEFEIECGHVCSADCFVFTEDVPCKTGSSIGMIPDNSYVNQVSKNGYKPSLPDSSRLYYGDDYNSVNSIEKLCSLVNLFPSKRPTGRVVTIIETSPRRNSIIGFLSMKQWPCTREYRRKDLKHNKYQFNLNNGYILLTPTDPKFPKMEIPVINLPRSMKKCLKVGDLTVENLIVGAKVVDWAEDNYNPEATVTHIFGRGCEREAQIASILFENGIDDSGFSPDALSCLPHLPWEVPHKELFSRSDLRNLCVFTIDPASASDLDDALSVECLPNGDYRVGVHIADVSYFVLPDTTLDVEAQNRSTSVYFLQRKIPMLPHLLSDGFASLNPGVDRLSFSIFWKINSMGEILDRSIYRTILCSCCKLSYEQAQDMIEGSFDIPDSCHQGNHSPQLYGRFEWFDVINSVKTLNHLSKILKEIRFKSGALSLESSKVSFLFNEEGIPYEAVFSSRKDSNFLVEEFMLLANRTVAELITRAYPSCALLRRHPEPNVRKLRDFEAFCRKHAFQMDVSSSSNLNKSLHHIRQELKNDSMFEILMSYAARSMQLASYFCSGDSKDSSSDWGHYALAIPLYTHFTSPLRRYPDILVHRALAATLEAENMYLEERKMLQNVIGNEELGRCFTGLLLDTDVIESCEAQEALSISAAKFGVMCTETLSVVAAHCNVKSLATRHVKDATDKLCMWMMIKKKKILYSEARVLGLGPKFMSIYVLKLSIERRIYYDETEGLRAEWLNATSTLVLNYSMHKRPNRKHGIGKCRYLEEVALMINPTNLKLDMSFPEHGEEDYNGKKCDIISHNPAVFPLTVNLLSTIPIALHAIGGDDGPIDIVARLYISSYFQ